MLMSRPSAEDIRGGKFNVKARRVWSLYVVFHTRVLGPNAVSVAFQYELAQVGSVFGPENLEQRQRRGHPAIPEVNSSLRAGANVLRPFFRKAALEYSHRTEGDLPGQA